MLEIIETELNDLKNQTEYLINNKTTLNEKEITISLRNFEKIRYEILDKIKLDVKTNKIQDFEKGKMCNLYSAKLKDNILKIYIPETLPKYKNISNYAYKHILLNTAEAVKEYSGLFKDNLTFVLIIVHEKQANMDIDNKYVKPIIDALVLTNVIHDDNINNMFYMALGKSDTKKPYTEAFIMDGKYMIEWINNLQKTI